MSAYALDRFLNNVFDIYALPNTMSDFRYTGTEYYMTSTDNEVTIEMPLPGVSKENLKVNVEDNLLTIEAKTDAKSKFAKSASKSWSLDDTIDVSHISAKLDNGLLTVTLPKIKPQKKTIAITVS